MDFLQKFEFVASIWIPDCFLFSVFDFYLPLIQSGTVFFDCIFYIHFMVNYQQLSVTLICCARLNEV